MGKETLQMDAVQKAIRETYKSIDSKMKDLGDTLGMAQSVFEKYTGVSKDLESQFSKLATALADTRYVKIDPPKAPSKMVEYGMKAGKALGGAGVTEIIEAAELAGPKEKKIHIYYKKGGEIIVEESGTITVQLISPRGTKKIILDEKKGILIRSDKQIRIIANDDIIMESRKGKIQIQSKEKSINSIAKKGISERVNDGPIREMAKKNIEIHSDEDTKIVSKKNFIGEIKESQKFKVTKDYEYKIDGKATQEIKEDYNIDVTKKYKVESKDNMDLRSYKNLGIRSQKNSVIKSDTADIQATAKAKVKIDGTAGVEAKAKASMKLEAKATLDVKGTGPVTVKSSAILKLKGTAVNIN